MAKYSSKKNFGFGNKLYYAGGNALRERCCNGHFGTVATYATNWDIAVKHFRANGVRDARDITTKTLIDYGQELREMVRSGELAVTTAQNRLSSINVVMEALRGDNKVWVSPSDIVGKRTCVRTVVPTGVDRQVVGCAIEALKNNAATHTAALVGLARDMGLRRKECALMSVHRALAEAKSTGKVSIFEGTKGGRTAERLVPVSAGGMKSLKYAAEVAGTNRNIIPVEKSLKEFFSTVKNDWAMVRENYGLAKIHDLRAAYACSRYLEMTGHNAPVVDGIRSASKPDDKAARKELAFEMGHGRTDVVAAYVGSAR